LNSLVLKLFFTSDSEKEKKFNSYKIKCCNCKNIEISQFANLESLNQNTPGTTCITTGQCMKCQKYCCFICSNGFANLQGLKKHFDIHDKSKFN